MRTLYAKSIIYFALVKACKNSACSVCNDENVCDLRIIDNLGRDLFREAIISMMRIYTIDTVELNLM